MKTIKIAVATGLVLIGAGRAHAQSIESVGTRALGMGGAFVAVADDATATYWNPAGLGTGPSFSALFDANTSDLVPGGEDDAGLTAQTRARRVTGRILALSTPALGLTYYRLGAVTLSPAGPAEGPSEDRQEDEVGLGAPSATSLVLHQFGATLVQTILPGLTLGSTVKVVRGQTVRLDVAPGVTVDEALDRTSELDRESTTRLDLDIGLMFAAGSVRVGAVARNLREPEFDVADEEEPVRLERQIRLGVAVTPGRPADAPGAATTIAVDVDLVKTAGVFGDQRQVAIGGEQWLANRRIGVRAGFRVNWEERDERSASIGLSLGVRTGTYVEGQLTRGRDAFERGWSIATRTSF